MKSTLALALCLLIAAVSNYSQPARSGPPVRRGPPPVAKPSIVSLKDPLNDFAKKGLPQAYNFGGIANKALAIRAADLILKNDDTSLPALIGALQLAGFTITDTNQKILYKPVGSNGTAFSDYEVAGMLRASFFGATTTLDKLARLYVIDSARLKGRDIGAAMLNDLRTARTSTNEQDQFLAELIFALSTGRADGLSTSRSAINIIQASMLERRLLGDLVSAYENVSGGQSIYRRPPMRETKAYFLNASYGLEPILAGAIDDSPCPEIETLEKAVGYKGKGEKIGKFFGYKHPGAEAMDDLFESLDLLKEVSGGIEKANLIMTYLKLLLSNMFIEADVDVPNSPLVRTKSSQFIDRGQERTVTAKFTIYFPNSKSINCVGKAIKGVGSATGAPVPEFEVPDEGPMKDVPVKWEPLDRAEKAPLYMDSFDGKDLYNQKTNDNGENKVKATGKEQRKDLTNVPVSPVPKKDRWRVSIATEKMDADKDLPKIFFGALSLKNGGPLGFLIEFIPEILGKMALKNFRIDIPVRDWEPCSEDWGGHVHYTRDLRTTVYVVSSTVSNGNSTGAGTRTNDIHEEAEITLNPRTKEEVAAGVAKKPAQFDAFGNYSTRFEGQRVKDPCCGSKGGSFDTRFISGTDTSFDSVFMAPFSLSFTGGDADFQLALGFTAPALRARIHDYLQVIQSDCPLEKAESYNKDKEDTVTFGGVLNQGRYGNRYLDTSGDFLVGDKQYQAPDKSTIHWEWEFSRCKPDNIR